MPASVLGVCDFPKKESHIVGVEIRVGVMKDALDFVCLPIPPADGIAATQSAHVDHFVSFLAYHACDDDLSLPVWARE